MGRERRAFPIFARLPPLWRRNTASIAVARGEFAEALSQPRECSAPFRTNSSQSRNRKFFTSPAHRLLFATDSEYCENTTCNKKTRKFKLTTGGDMRIHSDVPSGVTVTQILGRPVCPSCGETMYAAVETQFLGRGRISNRWSCEACDHQFQTSLELPFAECC
jgi:hypothetical protein